jgi:hypothetical protein
MPQMGWQTFPGIRHQFQNFLHASAELPRPCLIRHSAMSNHAAQRPEEASGVAVWEVVEFREGGRREKRPLYHSREESELSLLQKTHRWLSYNMSILPKRCQKLGSTSCIVHHCWQCSHEPFLDGISTQRLEDF